MFRLCIRNTRSIVAIVLFGAMSHACFAVDWGQVEGKTIPLFYTGQASWEWMLTQSDHSGAKDMRLGKVCSACHGDEQAKIGNSIVSGKRLEPTPPLGMPGSIDAEVKVAHDGERLYVRVSWSASDRMPANPMDPDHPAKISIMLNDGMLKEAALGGCWGACHDDLRHMASAKHELDLTKYVLASRTKITRKGGGEDIKDEAALKSLIKEGKFFEYWQARIDKAGNARFMDGYILERRHENEHPVVEGEMSRQGDRWVAVLSRALNTSGEVYKPVQPGKVYTVGFAAHSDYSEGRFHHVSLEQTLSLDGGNAGLVARKLP